MTASEDAATSGVPFPVATDPEEDLPYTLDPAPSQEDGALVVAQIRSTLRVCAASIDDNGEPAAGDWADITDVASGAQGRLEELIRRGSYTGERLYDALDLIALVVGAIQYEPRTAVTESPSHR